MKTVTLQDVFAGYKLTLSQRELVEKLEIFFKSKTENVFMIQGYAGTGKTFITKGLTEYLKKIGRNYILAAPTGKAAKVISVKTNSPAYTIHKTIYDTHNIKEFYENIEGSETYKFYADLAVNNYSVDTVYIIDEVSMVSDKYQETEFFRFGSGFLLRDFFKFVNLDHNDHNKKVIFIGDVAQLHPIGMDFSPALNKNYLEKRYQIKSNSYTLTDVVRQKTTSGILENAKIVRESLDSNIFNKLVLKYDFHDVDKISYEDIIDRYLEVSENKVNDNAILIAYSNADVANYNRAIRQRLLPGCREEILPGDKIMAVHNTNYYGIFISNGDFGIVRYVNDNSEIHSVILKRKNKKTNQVENITIELRFRKVELGFKDENGISKFFFANIIENLLYSDHAELSSDENKALYVDFRMRNRRLKSNSLELKDALKSDPYFNAMRIKFGYAITCHKAQGSEWKHVFIKCKSHNSGLTEDYFRWLYTAITRATKYLYLIDPPNFTLTDKLETVGSIPYSCQPHVNNRHIPVFDPKNNDKNNDHIIITNKDTNKHLPSYENLEDQSILSAILHKIKEIIASENITISHIEHNQYQESYFFMHDNELARINIWYNAKGEVSSIAAHKPSDLSTYLLNLLNKLKGSFLNHPTIEKKFEFQESFLGDFYNEIVKKVCKYHIEIVEIESKQWCQCYTFKRNNQFAKLNFWYNGKKQFKKISYVMNFQSDPDLIHELDAILNGHVETLDM